MGYYLYNDQIAVEGDDDSDGDIKTNANRAHAKGIILFDKTSAVWIIHSIPTYPTRPSSKKYGLDSSQSVYAQSMLCLTLPLSALSQVGTQLKFAYPQYYDSFVPASLKSNPSLTNLNAVITGDRVAKDPFYNIDTITTFEGNQFKMFHKNRAFGKDLYADLVATTLNSPLFTETWSHGVGKN